jgi:type II secretory pathway component PulF
MLLNEAMAQCPQVFPRQMTSVLRAGNWARTCRGFRSVRDYLEWLDEMMRDVRQASIYPVTCSVVCAFVLCCSVLSSPNSSPCFRPMPLAV